MPSASRETRDAALEELVERLDVSDTGRHERQRPGRGRHVPPGADVTGLVAPIGPSVVDPTLATVAPHSDDRLHAEMSYIVGTFAEMSEPRSSSELARPRSGWCRSTT